MSPKRDPSKPAVPGSPPARTSSRILPAWQAVLVRVLLGCVLVVGGTGLFLLGSEGDSPAAMAALAAHLVAGALGLLLLLPFTIPHAIAQIRRRPVIAFTGALVLAVALVVGLTGVLLTFERSALRPAWTWGAHVYGGLALFVLYAAHRRYGTNPAPWRRLALSVSLPLFFGLTLWAIERAQEPEPFQRDAVPHFGAKERDGPGGRFGLSLSQTDHGRFFPDSKVLTDVKRCGECHSRIVDDTLRSAHRHSSMSNVFYRGSIEEMRKRYPLVDTKWCAGCHDPALLFTGKMDDPDLDFMDPDAQVGLSCLACHAIEPQSVLGNGDYIVTPHRKYAWENSDDPDVLAAHDVLLRAKPDAHIESLRPTGINTGEFCSTCHKAQIPPELNRWHWFRAQDEYDAWHDSGVSLNNVRSFYHPKEAKSCQDCHMPLVADPADPTADASGRVRSHLFAAANTALPYLRGDLEMIERVEVFLQQATRLDFTGLVLRAEGPAERARLFAPAWRDTPAVRPGEIVEAHLVLRNQGVGHEFPGGTIDSNEVWIEFEVAVGDEEPFYFSGRIDPETGHVDQSAEFYRSWAVDRNGKRVVNRLGPDIYTVVYRKALKPGTADVVRYRFRVPEGAEGALKLRARLRYRKFMQEYVDFLFPDQKMVSFLQDDGTYRDVDITRLPVVDMAKAELEVPISTEGTSGPPPAPEDVAEAEDLLRVNDLAIAYLLQGDPELAERLFTSVTRIDPAYADGYVNVARARLARRDFAGALESLAEARKVQPDFLKARYFEGVIAHANATSGNRELFEVAEQRYLEVLKGFPMEREALLRLSQVQYELDRPQEALATLQRLFDIDPENANAWELSMDIYKELEPIDPQAKAKGEEARRAYLRFRKDDTMEQRAEAIRDVRPDLERMADRIHVHEQPGLGD